MLRTALGPGFSVMTANFARYLRDGNRPSGHLGVRGRERTSQRSADLSTLFAAGMSLIDTWSFGAQCNADGSADRVA